MAVRKLRSSWWVDFGYKRARYRQRSPINTREGAVAFEAELRHRILRGEPLDPQAARRAMPTFREFSTRWVDTYVRANNRVTTWRSERAIVATYLWPFFGAMRIDTIGTKEIEEFKRRQIAAGTHPGTLNLRLGVLRTCLYAARNWEVMERAPRVKLLPQPPGRTVYLQPAEVEVLLADRTDRRAHALAHLAVRTGMRRGELLALTWDDVDFDDGFLTVRRTFSGDVLSAPKNNRTRYIPLTRDTLEVLRGLPRASEFVFGQRPGKPADSDPMVRVLRRTLDRGGVRLPVPFGLHMLRHTFATLALRNRADTARIVLYSLLGEVQGWSAGTPAEDDSTLIVAKVRSGSHSGREPERLV